MFCQSGEISPNLVTLVKLYSNYDKKCKEKLTIAVADLILLPVYLLKSSLLFVKYLLGLINSGR